MIAAAGHRRAPRPLGQAIAVLTRSIAPATTLARVQAAWAASVGEAVAAAAHPSAEHDGVLTVVCTASVWAQELELMGPQLVSGLNRALGECLLTGVRCRVA